MRKYTLLKQKLFRSLRAISKKNLMVVLPFVATAIFASMQVFNVYKNGTFVKSYDGTQYYIKVKKDVHVFSVSEALTVEFAKSNTYWDGSAWQFEANPWDYQTSYDENHVSHLFWDQDASQLYSSPYGGSEFPGTSDNFFFCLSNKENYTVGGEPNWYALTGGSYTDGSDGLGQWDYLLNRRTVNGSTGEGFSYQRTTLTLSDGSTTKYGMLIFPDDYTTTGGNPTPTATTSWADWQKMDKAGVVFLPAAGYRQDSTIAGEGDGYYWSATPDSNDWTVAIGMSFNTTAINASTSFSRNYGYAVRLVKSVSGTEIVPGDNASVDTVAPDTVVVDSFPIM